MDEHNRADGEARASDAHRETWDAVWSDTPRGDGLALTWYERKLADALLPYPYPFNYFLRAWLLRWLPLSEIRVLEIGGAGGLGMLLAPFSKSYTLLDYSEAAIQKARGVLARTPGATCVLGDMFEHEPTEPPDLVISMGLIEHFFGAEKEKVLRAHMRMSRRYVCVGAPADSPVNWWACFRYETTQEYPPQRPVAERELFDLCLGCGLTPVAMTRLDPWYERKNKSKLALGLYKCFAVWWPSKKWALDRDDGGLVIMLAEKPST